MPGWGDVCRSMHEALSTGVLPVGYSWNGHFTIGHPFLRQLLTSYRSDRVGLCDLPPLLHDGMLTCPLLCLSFVCNHSYWWFENISFAFKQPRHRGSSRVKTLFPGLCIQRRDFPAVPLHTFPEPTGSHWFAPFLPPLCLQSSVPETLTAHVGKQYFFFSAGKLEWVAPWKQSHKMTSLLPHPPGHPLSPWICGQTLLTSGLFNISQSSERNPTLKEKMWVYFGVLWAGRQGSREEVCFAAFNRMQRSKLTGWACGSVSCLYHYEQVQPPWLAFFVKQDWQ